MAILPDDDALAGIARLLGRGAGTAASGISDVGRAAASMFGGGSSAGGLVGRGGVAGRKDPDRVAGGPGPQTGGDRRRFAGMPSEEQQALNESGRDMFVGTIPPTATSPDDPTSALEQLIALTSGVGGGTLAGQVGSTFDAQLGALAGAQGLAGQAAAEARGRTEDAFGYAGQVAAEGRGAAQETFESGQQQVGDIYDQLAAALGNVPSQVTEGLMSASGQKPSTARVAERVAGATAPFAAAGEVGRAASQANLAQQSSAAQNYLTGLQSAVGAEQAQSLSDIDLALQAERGRLARRAAEIEGAKQRAILEATADTGGETQERLMRAAAFEMLGMPTGQAQALSVLGNEGLRLLNDSGAFEQGDDLGQLEDLLDVQLKQNELQETLDPTARTRRIREDLSPPEQQLIDQVLQSVSADVSLGALTPSQAPFAATDLLAQIGGDPEALGEANVVPYAPVDPTALQDPLLALVDELLSQRR